MKTLRTASLGPNSFLVLIEKECNFVAPLRKTQN